MASDRELIRKAMKKARDKTAASFPPFPPKGGDVPSQLQAGGGQNTRDIPKDHTFDPRSLKPMSKALWASSMALGHTLAAYRELSRLKSATISPDGMMGGRGYVMPVKDMRQKLFEATEGLSAIADTLYDEINAPHWRPKLALLDKNDAEDVSRFVDKSQDILDNPIGEADDDMKEIEEANDKKKPKKDDDEAQASDVPGGGPTEEAAPPRPKEASMSNRVLGRFQKKARLTTREDLELAALGLDPVEANSSIPVDSLGGPRVDHIGPAEGDGPWGSYNEEEIKVEDPWQRDDAGEGHRDYDYPSEWDNDLRQAKTFTENGWAAHKQKHPGADAGDHTITKGEPKGDEKPKGEKKSPWGPGPKPKKSPAQEVEEKKKQKGEEKAERIEKEKAERGKKPKPEQGFGKRPERKEEPKKEEKKPWWKKLLKKEGAGSIPDADTDPTETEAWDFGIGYGAKGQGAGGYANPSNEGNGKGVWGPHSGLPGGPPQSVGDTSSPIDMALNDRHSQGLLPEDVVGPPARSDYFDGPKDNLMQSGGSELPGDGTSAPWRQEIGIVDTGHITEDLTTPYVRYDHTTPNNRPEHQHGRPEPLPWAHDGEVPL